MAIVAPVVITPSQSAGRRKSSLSQSTLTASRREASGELTHDRAFWSTSVASQSAPSAAGVTPPVTKWNIRGPADWMAACIPGSVSSRSAASVPSPSSGSDPAPRLSLAATALGWRSGAESSESRYSRAALAASRTASAAASRS